MTSMNGNESEMLGRYRLDDATAEAILAGRDPERDGLAPLLAFVEDVRALREGRPPRPHGALSEFVADGLSSNGLPEVVVPVEDWDAGACYGAEADRSSRRRRAKLALGEFVAGLGLLAKATLGVGVAAAVAGGVAATGVVELPGGPRGGETVVVNASGGDERSAGASSDQVPTGLPPAAAADGEQADEQRARADAFAGAIRAWAACVAGNAANAPVPRPEGFDPKTGCEAIAPESTPGGEPFGPGADPDAGEGPPVGPPGPPEGLPPGPPQGVPPGPPQGVPGGPPAVGVPGASPNE